VRTPRILGIVSEAPIREEQSKLLDLLLFASERLIMIEQRVSMAIPAAITVPIETVSQEIETQKSRVMAR
jgi:hypothetical protein